MNESTEDIEREVAQLQEKVQLLLNKSIENVERELAQLQEKLQLLDTEKSAQQTTSETQEQKTPTSQTAQNDGCQSIITRSPRKQTDPLVKVREDQRRRIIAAGKSLRNVNKKIEFFLADREEPFDFISRPLGDYRRSVINHWTDEMWKILKEDMPDEGWPFHDAHRRLQIICVDKRRNYMLAIKKAGRNENTGTTTGIVAPN